MNYKALLFLLIFTPAFSQTDKQDPNIFPNPNLTPGDILNVTSNDICARGYSSKVRYVTTTEKKQVFTEYGIPWSKHKNYEVDHFISLELGGSNDIKNLWPEPLHYQAINFDLGAKSKDKVEDLLHHKVCKGQLTLQEAQDIIKTNWANYYIIHYNHRNIK